ncbi:MAG: hypothetical protein QM689_03205 [Oscillospiraceae bacterium]
MKPKFCTISGFQIKGEDVRTENQVKGFKELWCDFYYKIHGKADAVIFVSKQYKDGCYEECDRFMVDNSDMLLWIGNRKSCITEYAGRNHKPVTFISTVFQK